LSNALRSGLTPGNGAPLRFGVVAVGCIAAVIAGCCIASYDNPLTATLIIAAMAIFAIAILNPKAGFYLLILGTGYIDLVKRLGILAGNLTYGDVVATVAVAPILSGCICVGVIIQCVFQRRRLERWQYVIFVVIVLLMISVLLKDVSSGTGLLAGLQDFANSGAYFPLALIAGILFPKPEDVKRFIKFSLIIYIPVALYAIWQQIFGLNDFEMDYLQTGYTITANLLDDVRPRPFSTLNSPHALTVMTAILALLSFFTHLKGSRRSGWQIPVGILSTAACVATVGRAGWVLLALGMIGWICFRRAWTTIGFYGLVTAVLALLIFNADSLLDSLETLQEKLPGGSAFTEQTFRISTFSDRLYSFRNMVTNPVFHTWFGNPELHGPNEEIVASDELVHDQLTQILVRFGFVGLSGFLFLLGGALWLTHRRVLAQRDLETRQAGIALLTVLAAVVYSGMLFGSHLGVFPVNVFFAFLVGALLVCCVEQGETEASALEIR
jgi:hypothetical protein